MIRLLWRLVVTVYSIVVCWYLVSLEVPSIRFRDAPWFVRGWLKFLTFWNLVSAINTLGTKFTSVGQLIYVNNIRLNKTFFTNK